jgi:hypothetical protein
MTMAAKRAAPSRISSEGVRYGSTVPLFDDR